jgi:CTP:molybdopterin cytidylyltransferase MocA
MGSPKALLPYGNETFLDRLCRVFGARCAPVIVVLGASADEIRSRTLAPVTFIVNPNYQAGQTGSMQCGLRAVPAECPGVLFTLVDHPAVAAATLDALVAAPLPLLRVPRYQGRRGHPICFFRSLIPEFLALPETGAAREVVRAHAAQTGFLDLDDPGIVVDIDDPAAYRALVGARP